MKKIIAVVALFSSALLAGCSSMPSGGSALAGLSGVMSGGSEAPATPYQQTEARVLKVRVATIHEENGLVTQIGQNAETEANARGSEAAGGGIVGGLISGVIGNVAHAVTANAEKSATAKKGILVVVKTNGGTIMSIAQAGKVHDFRRGQHVLIDWYSNGTKKVETL